MRIGDMELGGGAALAPMAGVTDHTMRGICAEFGAVFTVSEMVSAKALVMGDTKSRLLLKGRGGNAPYGVQLFGSDPATMAHAVKLIEKEDFDFLDINMGCPAPKISGNGSGSALLKNPPLAGEIAKAVVEASIRPVTVKLRIGWDDKILTGAEVAKRCEDAGVQMLTVHGRTKEQMYRPGVNHQQVAGIKRAVGIPVLFNGDIDSPEAAKYAIEVTGCDGFAVGRGAVGNPWLFAQLRAMQMGLPVPPQPTLRERMQVLERQIRGMCDEKGEGRAMREARGAAGAYMRGLREAASLRRQAHGLTYYTDLEYLIQEVYRSNPPDSVLSMYENQQD